MSTEQTGQGRLAAAYSGSHNTAEVARLKRIADAYKPEQDAEIERLRALGDKVPAATRVAIGYHDKAKAAHNELKKLEQ